MGLSDVLPKLKGENEAPPPPHHPLHAMLFLCSSYQWKTTNTPTLNGGEGRGGGWIGFFSEVTLFECICFLGKLYGYNVSTILSPIVGNL